MIQFRVAWVFPAQRRIFPPALALRLRKSVVGVVAARPRPDRARPALVRVFGRVPAAAPWGGLWRIFRIAQFANRRLYDAGWLFLSWLALLFVCAVFRIASRSGGCFSISGCFISGLLPVSFHAGF